MIWKNLLLFLIVNKFDFLTSLTKLENLKSTRYKFAAVKNERLKSSNKNNNNNNFFFIYVLKLITNLKNKVFIGLN